MIDTETLRAVALITGTFIVSWSGVRLFRSWSVRRQLLDIPNERSSHSRPTPRGGGLVIAGVGLIGYAAIAWLFATPFSVGYFLGAILVAVVSWLDDLYSLSFWTRLIIHLGATLMLVADLGVWHAIPVPFGFGDIPIGPVIGGVVTVIWVVWFLNAYNFMDGIDGIASLQSMIAALGWVVVGAFLQLEGLTTFAGVLAAVSLAFLIHNWPPARIFMGDVGSAFLGFTLAALPLLGRNERQDAYPPFLLLAVMFVWFFVSDTLFTFIRRAVKGEKVWEAHRSHIYQRMIISGMSHRSVTLLYGAGAAILTLAALLSWLFAGIYSVFGLSLLVILTGLQLYLGSRKKALT
jgi:UDP-N-acetylmuramyl pentapeptide phosphotransferase/UDP-N-acetylglucosamine-1-phosphate transferase